MNSLKSGLQDINRRTFLGRGAAGLGLVAFNSLLKAAASNSSHGAINPLDFPAKARRVIFLYQAGGPSHLETFDFKPKLAELSGKPMPESMTKGQQIAQLQGKQLICFGPQHGFKTFGKSGQQICELFPHIGSATARTRRAMAVLAIRNLDSCLSTGELVTPVLRPHR